MRRQYQDIFTSMENIPYQTGYSVQHWKWVIDALIMKNSTDYRVNGTRRIPIKDEDQNVNENRMTKDAMIAAEIYNLLINKQYDSCLYRSAIHLATNKRLIYVISRKMKTNIAVCSNDARSCYDRIVHVAAFLPLRWLGIPKSMIISMLHTIHMIKYDVRNSFGGSNETDGALE